MQPLPPLPATPFGQGGESLIFEHPTRQDLLIKLFTDQNHQRQPRVGADAIHIESLNEFQNGITLSHRQLLSTNFSWPIEIYGRQPGVIEGIGILRAPSDFWIDVHLSTGKSKRYFLQLGFLTTDFLEKPVIKSATINSATFKSASFEDRVEVALEFLYSLQVLWDLGYRFCDFKEQNFSFTLAGRPKVFIIDAESISPPNESKIRSPEWYPPSHLAYSMESDRSLACLLVWRILGKDPGIKPPSHGGSGFLSQLDARTLRLISDGYQNGSQDIIDELIRMLNSHRSEENIRKALNWAADTQLATLVLRNIPANPTRQEAQIVADARDQRKLEDDLMALDPRLRQLRKNQSVPLPGFIFDIPDSVVLDAIDRDGEIIRALALDGAFEEVAQAFRGRTLAAPVSQVATRAIQAAIAQLGPPPVRTSSSSGRDFRMQWSWPGTDVVTGARIRLFNPDGTLTQEGYCDRATRNPSVSFDLLANIPDGSRLEVCYAMHFDDGETIVCPLGTESIITNASQSNYATRSIASSGTRTVTTSGDSRSTNSQNASTLQGQFEEKKSDPIVGTGSSGGTSSGSRVGTGSTNLGQSVNRGGRAAHAIATIQKGFTRLLRRK